MSMESRAVLETASLSTNVHPFPSSAPSAARFCVDAVAECSVMPRVVEQFASLGLVPSRLAGTVDGDDLRIDLTLDGMPRDRAEYLARRLGRIMGVRSVETTTGP